MSAIENEPGTIQLTVQLLSAYLANNTVASEDLAGLITTTRAALAQDAAEAPQPAVADIAPAVSARKSLSSPNHIVSLIDGKPYKALKRHLTAHGLTPDAYRERYNLPASYPMVAPAFAAKRREIAERIGLGRRQASEGEVQVPVAGSLDAAEGEHADAAMTIERAKRPVRAKAKRTLAASVPNSPSSSGSDALPAEGQLKAARATGKGKSTATNAAASGRKATKSKGSARSVQGEDPSPAISMPGSGPKTAEAEPEGARTPVDAKPSSTSHGEPAVPAAEAAPAVRSAVSKPVSEGSGGETTSTSAEKRRVPRRKLSLFRGADASAVDVSTEAGQKAKPTREPKAGQGKGVTQAVKSQRKAGPRDTRLTATSGADTAPKS